VPINDIITTSSVIRTVNSFLEIGFGNGSNLPKIAYKKTPRSTYNMEYDICVFFVIDGIHAIPKAAIPIIVKTIM
jgi:hypothetical protein